MAIKLADTARPNNYVDTEHPGTFPVAYAEDVWFADGTRLSEKTFDGQSVQKEELPLASATEEGNIYQYIGVNGTYTNGYFYKCVSDGESTPTYSWEQKDVQPSRYKSINFLTMTGAKYQCITGLKLGGAYLIEIGYNMFIVRVLDNFGDQSQKKYGFEIELLGQNLNDTTNAFYNYPVYLNNFEDNALAPILAIYVSNGDRTNIRVTQISGVVNNDFDFGTFYTSTPSAPFKKSTFYSAASMREAIAPLFNDNTSYNVGDIIWKRVNTSSNSSRVHDNIELYRCIVAHSGSWSSAHFEKIQLCKDFKSGSKVFSGTMDEWDALTEAEKAKYDFIATPDEAVEDIADAIIDGDMRAITSNAVAQVVPSDASASNKLVTVADITPRTISCIDLISNVDLSEVRTVTADRDGFFIVNIEKSSGASGNTVRIKVNNKYAQWVPYWGTNYGTTLCAFVRNGDEIEISADGAGSEFKIASSMLQGISWT